MKKNSYFYLCLLTLGLMLLGCSKDDGPGDTGPDIKSFSPLSGPVGTSIFITGKNFGATAAANTVKIGTTTATITSAKATEIFVTIPEGATTGKISVTVDGKTDTAGTFTVTESQPLGIVLNKNQTTLYPYNTYKETLSVTSDLEGNTVTWTSDDETVATVDQNGVVTPLKIGEAKITAAAGGGAAECKINVVDGPVATLELDKETLELFRDGTATLEIAVLEAAVENTTPAVWSSDNEAVATVDQEGNITAIAPGQANITATVDNKYATSALTVNPDVYVGGYENFDGDFVPTVWKNGVPTHLPMEEGEDFGLVSAVFVTDSGVYAVGRSQVGNQFPTARLWHNNALVDLELGEGGFSEAYSVYVDGQDVYVAGSDNGGTVWKNGEVLYKLGNRLNAIFVNGDKVYTAGHELNDQDEPKAMVWENETATDLTAGSGSGDEGLSVHVDKQDVYVAGTKDRVATVWRNGEVLHSLTDGMSSGFAYSIVVSDGKVYTTGNDGNVAYVSKNKNILYNLTEGTYDAKASSIQVYGEDVYVAGSERIDNNTGVAKVWKNNSAMDLGDGIFASNANSIFIW
ncbi:Ig-like domain-containing protein [Flagellimonas sp.]|uniref:Ig-like domain-containing protein n=1 Tax=Flagellimonas sp. TaxID=2058762 RepID=UPI003B5BE9EE